MKWYRNLYVGNTAKKKERVWIDRLEEGKSCPGLWLLTLPSNPQNNLDLIPADLLLQKFIRKDCPMIVGLAFGYREALLVLREITEQVVRTTGTADLKDWLIKSDKDM